MLLMRKSLTPFQVILTPYRLAQDLITVSSISLKDMPPARAARGKRELSFGSGRMPGGQLTSRIFGTPFLSRRMSNLAQSLMPKMRADSKTIDAIFFRSSAEIRAGHTSGSVAQSGES